MAEVLEETAIDYCITPRQVKDLREGLELGTKLDKKIHKAVTDAMKHDWKEFALDVGGTGGVISILYKFISQDVRKIISESYDDVLLVFDTVRSTLNVKKLTFDLNDVRGVRARSARISINIFTFSCFKNITHIAHSCHKEVTRKATLEGKCDYDEK